MCISLDQAEIRCIHLSRALPRFNRSTLQEFLLLVLAHLALFRASTGMLGRVHRAARCNSRQLLLDHRRMSEQPFFRLHYTDFSAFLEQLLFPALEDGMVKRWQPVGLRIAQHEQQAQTSQRADSECFHKLP